MLLIGTLGMLHSLVFVIPTYLGAAYGDRPRSEGGGVVYSAAEAVGYPVGSICLLVGGLFLWRRFYQAGL